MTIFLFQMRTLGLLLDASAHTLLASAHTLLASACKGPDDVRSVAVVFEGLIRTIRRRP